MILSTEYLSYLLVFKVSCKNRLSIFKYRRTRDL